MAINIKDKVALLTGSEGLLGPAFGTLLLEKGAKGVVFLGSEKANDINKELVEKFGGERVMLYTCDITDQASMKAGFEEAKARFERVDVVCNCGSSWDEIKWENTVQVSLHGVIHGTRLALEYLEPNGLLVNVTSVAAMTLAPYLPIISACKAAVLAYTKTVAKYDPVAKAQKIRVNVFLPCPMEGDEMSSAVLAEEKVQQHATITLTKLKTKPPNIVASALMMLIDQDRHDETLYVHGELGPIFAADDTDEFRRKYRASTVVKNL
ncbi:15-hydroxyprostaglandin dehydrogenase [NAD(+)]-like [Acanthaster planci]|uniref:15-hydroxyprostaglandin dehydrogenase [NAD(+)] n=1 Tax=Acanthaster planci TaxID=133434 RepID=A0A8B7XW62_ACAPL|nr:15-hydroxyprostaglandin dehydrogenase [NAD(+)]-like [Acanthaster planci]